MLSSLLIIALTTLIIWKSGEGFEVASDYLGRNLQNGVKGATINAIGSSLPEMLTTIFFLFILKNENGFIGGLGTTVGSAVFNAVIIPLIVGLTVFIKFNKKSFTYSRRVILRDGIALIIVDIILLLVVKDRSIDHTFSLTWIEGGVLMLAYLVYLWYLLKNRGGTLSERQKIKNANPSYEHVKRSKYEFAKAFFRLDFSTIILGKNKITTRSAIVLLIFSMLVMSGACYELAESSIALGNILEIPIFIVTVILVAAATSVPDTFLSYKDALKGNYADSFSNAFGSNVFDIGFAIGMPVMLFGLIYGVEISISEDTERVISELLVLLLIVTIAVFIIFMTSNKLTVYKLILLLMLYIFFTYIVLSNIYKTDIADGVLSTLYKISEFFAI